MIKNVLLVALGIFSSNLFVSQTRKATAEIRSLLPTLLPQHLAIKPLQSSENSYRSFHQVLSIP